MLWGNMFRPTFRRALAAALVIAAAGTVFASGQYDTNRTIFLATWKNDSKAATKLVSRFGRLSGKDSSGMYIVQLKKGVSPEAARAALKGNKATRYVFSAKAAILDKSNIHAVDQHIAFLKATYELKGKKDDEREAKMGAQEDEGAGTDFLESYRYFLEGRTDSNGNLNSKAYIEAAQHRSAMQPTVLPVERIGKTQGNWEFLGPKRMTPPYQQYFGSMHIAGRISDIEYTNVAGKMYVSTADGGVWKSTDGGATFTPLSDSWQYLWTSGIAVDPTNSDVVYAGTGDFDGFTPITNMGVMKTTDGGATWTKVNNNFGDVAIKGIVVDPDDHNRITAAGGNGDYSWKNGGQIWQSLNGGASWTARTSAPIAMWSDVEISAADSSGKRTYWAAGGRNVGGLIYKSTDRGVTWTQVTSPGGTYEPALDMACSKFNRDTVYLLTGRSKKIWKSVNGGTNWTDITNNYPQNLDSNVGYNFSQANYDYVIGTVALPTGQDGVYCGTITGAFSNNGGATWYDVNASYQLSAVVHADQHAFAANPLKPLEFATGSDGGLYKHVWNDGTAVDTITSLNDSLGIAQFFAITVHPTDTKQVMGGTQDNGSPASIGDFENWKSLYAGDGGWSAYDAPHNRKYTTSQNLSIWRYDNGVLQNYMTPTWQSKPGFIAPIAMTNDNSYLLAGTQHLNRYDGTSWTQNLGGQQLTTGYIRCLATSPSSNSTIYAGTDDGKLWVTPDLGSTWTQVNGNSLPANQVISSISVHPTNPKDVLVTRMGFGGLHVYHCADTFSANRMWVNITGSGASALPDVPANSIARDPFDPDSTYYVGNDNGVFRTENGGGTWTQMTNSLGLPNVQVNDLKVNKTTGYLYAGTYGRGIWRIKVADVSFTLAVAKPTLVGGNSTTGTLTFSGGVNAGTSFTVSSNASNIVVPSGSTSVPTGATSATFHIGTHGVDSNTSGTITVTWNGTKQTAKIYVNAAKALSVLLPTTTTVGGSGSTGASVVLDGNAGPSGVAVAVSSDQACANVPATVTVPSGLHSQSFRITTSGVDAQSVAVITGAARGGSATSRLTVNPAQVIAVALTPNPVISGGTITAIVKLNGLAGPSGRALTLSGSPSTVGPPSNVSVAAGQDHVSFKFAAPTVSSTLTAKLTAADGVASASDTVLVNPATLTRLDLKPNPVQGGTTVSGVAVLNGKAGADLTGTVTSHNTAVAHSTSSPTIPAGLDHGSFKIVTSPVAASTDVQFDVTIKGVTVSNHLTVTPAIPQSLSFSSATVTGGTSTTCQLFMSGKAPAAGLDVVVVSSKPTVATCPSPIHVPAGASNSLPFTISTTKVTAQTKVTFTATYAGAKTSATLTINP